VADSSLSIDTKIQPRLYAQGMVEEYWVVDLQHREVIISP